jgi:hypothetical protein
MSVENCGAVSLVSFGWKLQDEEQNRKLGGKLMIA